MQVSERKTAEVKFRCTPTFKSGLQAAAEAEGISASQLIENSVQEHVWAKDNARIDGTKITGAIGVWDADRVQLVYPATAEEALEPEVEVLDPADSPFQTKLSALCACRPWEFCTHKDTE
jgi:hypothetical protein